MLVQTAVVQNAVVSSYRFQAESASSFDVDYNMIQICFLDEIVFWDAYFYL
jgi:hypothetical protein